ALRALATAVSDTRGAEPTPSQASDLRQRIQDELAGGSVQSRGTREAGLSKVQSREGEAPAEPVTIAAGKKPWWRRTAFEVCVVGGICCALLMLLLLPAGQLEKSAARMQASNELQQLPAAATGKLEVWKHAAPGGSPPGGYVGVSGATNHYS